MEGGQKNIFSAFISESELAEVKKRRQEEWTKNRKPGQPLERPDEPVDHRSLYDRLQEQKKAKDAEYEKEHKLGNQIQKLDEGDAEFLSFVSQRQMEMTREKDMEEQELMEELKKHRSRKTTSLADKLKLNLPPAKSIIGAAKRKRSSDDDDAENKKQKLSSDNPSSSTPSSATRSTNDGTSGHSSVEREERSEIDNEGATKNESRGNGRVEVLGYLPGIGPYSDDSNSSTSSSNSEDEIDLVTLKKCCTVKHAHKTSGC